MNCDCKEKCPECKCKEQPQKGEGLLLLGRAVGLVAAGVGSLMFLQASTKLLGIGILSVVAIYIVYILTTKR